MRRLLTVSLGLCTALSAHAALLNTSHDHVTVPCFKGGFEFGLTGAYMRSDYHSVAYALRDTTDNDVSDGTYLDIDSEYHFAWGAMVGWRFANTANDMRLSYFAVNTDDSDSARASESVILHPVAGVGESYWYGGPPQDEEPENVSSYLQSARGQNEFDLTAIDLEFGQHFDVGYHTTMRFFAGVSHHTLEKDTRITYVGVKPALEGAGTSLHEGIKKHSDFEGWGPRIGFDAQYAFNNGFGLVGHFSSAFLFGEIDSVTSTWQTEVEPDQEQEGEILPLDGHGHGPKSKVMIKSRHIVVPNVDLRLGVDYSYAFDGGSIVTTELGYWGKSYFGGVNDTTLGTYRHSSQVDNVTFHGAYLSLIAHL